MGDDAMSTVLVQHVRNMHGCWVCLGAAAVESELKYIADLLGLQKAEV